MNVVVEILIIGGITILLLIGALIRFVKMMSDIEEAENDSKGI